ncbi:hypothetical protein NE237_026060 [Protea cynaroides]|uniref:Uncharacterized protein n=1 Tax=Protea cynaroides TaxID=273540 RepID=A0A9Q0H4A3_9MAGN|nr:hypothetical protein NE237_026060 [Protea cynaroides]
MQLVGPSSYRVPSTVSGQSSPASPNLSNGGSSPIGFSQQAQELAQARRCMPAEGHFPLVTIHLLAPKSNFNEFFVGNSIPMPSSRNKGPRPDPKISVNDISTDGVENVGPPPRPPVMTMADVTAVLGNFGQTMGQQQRDLMTQHQLEAQKNQRHERVEAQKNRRQQQLEA